MSNASLQPRPSVSHHRNIISELVKGELVPGPIWKKREYRLKFILRSLLFWSSTQKMLKAISRRSDFDKLLSSQITLPSKTHRMYLSRGMNAMDRADAIICHYEWIDALSDHDLVSALTSPQESPVVEFHAKDDLCYTVYASSASKAEREGEATLWLRDQDNTLLASLTFCVAKEQDRQVLVIGGLQGPRRSVSRDVIKNATRACHGLFPKRILLEVISLLASHSDIKAIYAVSDEGHVFRALRYRLSKGRHFHASYDEFWASIEGQKISRFRWQLPLQMERKSLEEIASKKRAEYRRRFGLLDEIAEGINARF
ncbi:VirK/YbjX family protein [Lelliottia wanjuensis]|uniref:VirK/YbjX family protein n=1 Tax=Lelliottia wanjuensis TaxID=3050585 RepID=UPI00254EF8CE|nr:VirK/YbjX family protein [Lelliottia sp. V104_15]MDK9607653.1 VirK/YbjX family protein [Lelliottia sp. V104_15]